MVAARGGLLPGRGPRVGGAFGRTGQARVSPSPASRFEAEPGSYARQDPSSCGSPSPAGGVLESPRRPPRQRPRADAQVLDRTKRARGPRRRTSSSARPASSSRVEIRALRRRLPQQARLHRRLEPSRPARVMFLIDPKPFRTPDLAAARAELAQQQARLTTAARHPPACQVHWARDKRPVPPRMSRRRHGARSRPRPPRWSRRRRRSRNAGPEPQLYATISASPVAGLSSFSPRCRTALT
jgi:hypothetical protein